jgi:hypothetical protein
MKITIEPTEHFFMAGDVMVRMWQGVDDAGQELIALVSCVAFAGQAAAVAEGLVPIPPPDDEAARMWATSILEKLNDLSDLG